MKTIIDYLKTKGKFEGCFSQHDIVIDLNDNEVLLWCDEDKWLININDTDCAIEHEIQDILDENYQTEIRFCEECGKPMDKGYIAGDGDWYCCEDCFESAMNATYGKGKWKATKEEGYYGGFYAYFDGKEWEDTSVFWTSWN